MQWSSLGPGEHVAKRTAAARALHSCDGHAGHAMAKFVSARDGQELVVHFRPVQQLLCANAAGCGDERLHVTSGIDGHRHATIVVVARLQQYIYVVRNFTVKRMSNYLGLRGRT